MIYHNMDCLQFLESLPDRSIDAIILDPPYYRVVNDKWDNQWKSTEDYLTWCKKWLAECSRVSIFYTKSSSLP